MAHRPYNPPSVPVPKVGVYEVEPPIRGLGSPGSQYYSYWDGRSWSPAVTQWEAAVASKFPARVQCKHWREVGPQHAAT